MNRYGIAEWYGKQFLELTPEARQKFAQTALNQSMPAPTCPFMGKPCNKKGGVCTIQPYTPKGKQIERPAGPPVIVCPVRFEEKNLLLHWLADIVGFNVSKAQVAREVPFMENTTTGQPAGKIDIVLAQINGGLQWFGLEIQAVYFSGTRMEVEFEALSTSSEPMPPYPIAKRRPDWRSSSAKRLLPQLQIKGPTLRRWASKIAVAVDKPFFTSVGGPSTKPGKEPADGDVIWLVPELVDGILKRGHWEVLTLEETEEKLRSARKVNKHDFERLLRKKLKPMTSLGFSST